MSLAAKAAPSIHQQFRTSAQAQQAWQSWTDPELLAHWFCDRAEGSAEPGGKLTLHWERFGASFTYDVVEATPPSSLSLAVAMGPGKSVRLDICIQPFAYGTVLKLAETFDPPDDAHTADHASGWQMALAIQKHYLENYFGQPRQTFFAMRPARFTDAQLKPFFHTEAGLAAWLTQSGSIGYDGTRHALVLRGGAGIEPGVPLGGEVLTVTDREVAITWEEISGVLELKAFSMGAAKEDGNAVPQRMLALSGSSWGSSAAGAARWDAACGEALDRLVAALGK